MYYIGYYALKGMKFMKNNNLLDSTIGMILILIMAILLGYIIIKYIVEIANQIKYRREFCKRYNIVLDKQFRVSKYYNDTECYCDIGLGRWEHERKNGLRDCRYKSNRICRTPSILIFNGWEIKVNSPYLMINLVSKLRESGYRFSGFNMTYEDIVRLSPDDMGIY